MNAADEFSIEYVPPGIVRSGRSDITDFCLIYRADKVKLYFMGLGVWLEDRLSGYRIELPRELMVLACDDARMAWERVRTYVIGPQFTRHANVTMESFEEAWRRGRMLHVDGAA